MPHRKQESNPDFVTLDEPARGPVRASPAFGCIPPNCLIGDRMSKWRAVDGKDYANAECPRCGFATISLAVAQARRPGFDFKAKGLADVS